MKYNGKNYNYHISETGEVRHKKILTVIPHRYTKGGKPFIQIRLKKKLKTIQIIKALAQNYLPNPLGLSCANLKEGCELHYKNVYWTGRKLSDKDIKLCKKLGKSLGVTRRAKMFDLSRQGIYDVDNL